MSEYEAGRCVIGEKAHRASHGYLCGNHEQILRNTMREIEFEAEHLDAVPSMAIRLGASHSGLASEQAVGRLNVVAMNDKRTIPHRVRPAGPACHACWHDTCMIIRRWQDALDAQALELMSVLGTLYGWGRTVREEREMTGPEHITITSERDWLDRQLIWCVEQPWIDEMYHDMRKLLAQIQGANSTGPDKPYGPCPAIVAGQPCTGKVWIHDEERLVWRRHPDRCTRYLELAPGAAVCDTCAAKWEDDKAKERLKVMIEDLRAELARPFTDDGVKMLTADELVSKGVVTSLVNVRVIAHRNGVVSVGGYYDPRLFGTRVSA